MIRFSFKYASIPGMLLFFVMLSVPAFGQVVPEAEEDRDMQTEFMMMNQHVCHAEHFNDVMDMARGSIAPILSELQDDGEINDWGILTHLWGDKYNFNFFIITDDHRAFLDAWDSFVERSDERDPDWFEQWAPLCAEYKDNLYTLHRYADVEQDPAMEQDPDLGQN